MNLKSFANTLRRRTLMLVAVVALSAALLPTAAFASGGYGHQGRAWDPGPRQHRPQQHRPQHRPQPVRCDETYRVKRGDSLSKIAQWYGVSVHELAKANGIKNPNRIYAGQILCIPC